MSNDDMKGLWQAQAAGHKPMTLDEVRANAGRFGRQIRWRNAREYSAAAVVVAFFGMQMGSTEDAVIRAGLAMTIAGLLYMVWRLHAMGAAGTLPGEAGMSSFLEFQRRALERQRDLLNGVWRWYLGPLIPGLAVMLAGFWRANPGHLRHPEFVFAPAAMVVAAVFLGIAKLNTSVARKLDRQIAEIDKLAA